MSEYATPSELIVYVLLRTVMLAWKNAPNCVKMSDVATQSPMQSTKGQDLEPVIQSPSITARGGIRSTNQHGDAIHNFNGFGGLIRIKMN